MFLPSMTFSEYLGRYSRLSDELQSCLVSLVEDHLTGFLRQWVLPEFGGVHDDAYGHTFYERAKAAILGNQACKDALGAEELNLYTQALKQWAAYLEWQKQRADIGSTGKKRGRAHESEPLPSVPPLTEGELSEMHVVKRERNQEARAQCIAHYRRLHGGRLCCECCGFDFAKVYGGLGDGFIEVHHLSPVSQREDVHAVDPSADLVPLCANCHGIIHRLMARENCEGVESLRRLRKIIGREEWKDE